MLTTDALKRAIELLPLESASDPDPVVEVLSRG
jgi:hypothetical protein